MESSTQQKSWNSVPMRNKYSRSAAPSPRTSNPGSLKTVKRRLDFLDVDEEDENGLDFTDKLKAFRKVINPKKNVLVKREQVEGRSSDSFNDEDNRADFKDNEGLRGVISPNKHVLVKRELQKGREAASEAGQGPSYRDGERSLKKKDGYNKLLVRPASIGPEVVKDVSSSKNALRYLSGRASVGVCSDVCRQDPCSAQELATRLEHVDERLQSYEFRSPDHIQRNGSAHSTPAYKSRTHKSVKKEELDQWSISDDHCDDWRKEFLKQPGASGDAQTGHQFGHTKDLNSHLTNNQSKMNPDVHVLLDRLKQSRCRKVNSPYKDDSFKRTYSAQMDTSEPFEDRDLGQLERPQSCFTSFIHTERDLGNIERPRSCNLDHQYKHIKTVLETPHNQSKKREPNNSIRQTNVPFYDEIASPSGSERKYPVVRNPASLKTPVIESERYSRDNYDPELIIQTQRIRTPHKTTKNEKLDISGGCQDVQNQQLDYVRHLHNTAVTGDQVNGTSGESSVDALSQVSSSHTCKKDTGSVYCSDWHDRNSENISDFRKKHDRNDKNTSEFKHGYYRNGEHTSELRNKHHDRNIEHVSDFRHKNDGRNSEHISELRNREKYLNSLTDKLNYSECGHCFNDVQCKREPDLDVGWSDTESGPLSLSQLRELHNKAFGNSDNKHVSGSLTSSTKQNSVSEKSEENANPGSFRTSKTMTDDSRWSDKWHLPENPVNSDLNSDVDKYSKEYLHHKTIWNREQQSYKRNVQKVNELLERSLTPSLYETGCQRPQHNGALERRSLTPGTFEMQMKSMSQNDVVSFSRSVEPSSIHRIEKHSRMSKDYPSKVSPRKPESSSCVEKSRKEQSYTPVSNDKDKERKRGSPSRIRICGQMTGSVSTEIPVDKQRSQTPGSKGFNMSTRTLEQRSQTPGSKSFNMATRTLEQRSHTPGSYERQLKQQSNHSHQTPGDLISGLRENGKTKSVSNCVTKADKPTPKSQTSPQKVTTRVIKRVISPSKSTQSNKKESSASNSPQKKQTCNVIAKRNDDSGHHNQRSNSSKCLKKVVSRSRSHVAELTDDSERLKSDAEEQPLCLDEVRKLHFEVDQRLQDEMYISFHSDSELSDEHSAVSKEWEVRKRNTTEKSITHGAESANFKNNYLNLEKHGHHNLHNANDPSLVGVKGHNHLDNAKGQGQVTNGTGHGHLVGAKGYMGNGHSVEMSADITIPKLFGMKITKTVTQINDGVESKDLKLDKANVQYEVTISNGKENSQIVANNLQSNGHLNSLGQRATGNNFTTSSKILHQNESRHVGRDPRFGRSNIMTGTNPEFCLLDMVGHQNKEYKERHWACQNEGFVTGQKNEEDDATELINQELCFQRGGRNNSDGTCNFGNYFSASENDNRNADHSCAYKQNEHNHQDQEDIDAELRDAQYLQRCYTADSQEYDGVSDSFCRDGHLHGDGACACTLGQDTHNCQDQMIVGEQKDSYLSLNRTEDSKSWGCSTQASDQIKEYSDLVLSSRRRNEFLEDLPFGDPASIESSVEHQKLRKVTGERETGYSEYLQEIGNSRTTQAKNRNTLVTSSDGGSKFLDSFSAIDAVGVESFIEGGKERKSYGGMGSVDRMVMSRTCNVVDSADPTVWAKGMGDSRLVFEPPEKDTSTPLKNYYQTKQDQLIVTSGSLNSPFTAADTIMAHLGDPGMVRLLRQLYNVSDTARPDLILKAKCFKEWHRNVQGIKQQRQYNIRLQQANRFYMNWLKGKCFRQWLDATVSQQQDRRASLLYRRIMLRKGLQAFKWAIGRSRHSQDILQNRVQSILLTTTFVKWHRLTEERQRQRLLESFRAWRNLTVEVQSLRSFEKSVNEKLVQKMMTRWKEVFVVCIKQHKADEYSRRTLLKHMFGSWTSFTSLSQQQAHRHQVAVHQYGLILQKKMFGEMIQVYKKHQKAKWHYSHHKLVQFFRAWRLVIVVCKTEQEENLHVSVAHWSLTATRSYFLCWKVALGNMRARRMADKNLLRNTFVTWRTIWQQQNERRIAIEQRIKMNKVCHAFRQWRKNVVTRRRRQLRAIALLERALQQQTVLDWHCYTDYKKQLNKKLKSYQNRCNQQQQAEAFQIWYRQFQQKVDEERARRFWSDKCVVKCVYKWKHVCRKRRLRSLLIETEPDRQLRCLHVMFHRWLALKHEMDQEKLEASEARQILDSSQLRRRFLIWRLETLQALTIKPLLVRRKHKLLARCFAAWSVITQHKAECQRSRSRLLKFKLRQIFGAWRRQYVACQLGKEMRHKTDMGLVVACVQEWAAVLQRKHAAHTFNERNCVRHVFTYWKLRTANTLQAKADALEKEEQDMALKRFYFSQWVAGIQGEMTENDDMINMLQQRQAYNRIRRSFAAWRHHLHATFIARAYHKNLCQRLLRTVMVEWHLVADHSLADAVQRFADQLGLPVPDERDSSERSEASFASLSGYHSNSRDISCLGDADFEMGQNSPRSTSSAAYSFRRLFGTGDSPDRSDPDGMSIIGHGFLDSTHVEENQARADRVKDIVITVVKRLRHWPVSVLFDQWKEFTARQLELKRLSSNLVTIHHRCVMTLAFREWHKNYQAILRAKKHRSKLLLSRTFSALQRYVQKRKEKTRLSGVARKHHLMVVFQKVFPLWLAKSQQRQHDKHVLHLWSTTTPEEQRLLPLEDRLRREFSRRSLRVCFSVWCLKHQFTAKIKHAYYNGLTRRCFLAWSQWAQKQHEHHQKCVEFKHRRMLSMTFKVWQQRLQQKCETERRFSLAWNSYLQLILQTWAAWAKANHGRRLVARQLIDRQDTNSLRQRFTYWRSVTRKVQQAKVSGNTRLLTTVLHEWRQVVARKQNVEQTVLEFRVRSYTRLVKVLFKKWVSYRAWRLKQKQEQEAYRQNQALVLARKWKKQARASRGQRLHDTLAANKMRTSFSKWKAAFGRCLDREDTLQELLDAKNRRCLSLALDSWHTHYLGNQAAQVFNLKLQAAVLEEWSQWAKASRERRIRGLALQRALEERNLHTYFKYWHGLMQVQQSIRTHVGLKIQTRVLQAWHSYVQRRRQLADLQNIVTQKVNLRITTLTFQTMRCQFDYCQALNDTASSVTAKKNKNLLRKTLGLWQARLDAILASRCYGKLLAVRVVRQWRRFVKKRVDERQKEKDDTELAVRHYNKTICKVAISALYNQVLECRQRKRHGERMATKYAKLWKHRVDLEYTARCVNEERLYQKTWLCWRIEFTRRKVSKSVELYNRRQLISQVFLAWYHVCMKKKKKSCIPIPVTLGQGQIQSRSSIPVPIGSRSLVEPLRRSRNQPIPE